MVKLDNLKAVVADAKMDQQTALCKHMNSEENTLFIALRTAKDYMNYKKTLTNNQIIEEFIKCQNFKQELAKIGKRASHNPEVLNELYMELYNYAESASKHSNGRNGSPLLICYNLKRDAGSSATVVFNKCSLNL